MDTRNTTLLVSELFYSIQGETTKAGFPSFFIRLAGCNLNCSWCDTRYAQLDGKPLTIEQILHNIHKHPHTHHITITGGEPLIQENTIILLNELCNRKYLTQLETNGSIALHNVPYAVHKIVDVKTPSSGYSHSFCFENIPLIHQHDEIKFVIADINDYTYSVEFIKKYLANTSCVINFSPVAGVLKPHTLAEYILRDNINVRINIQLHKILWNNEPKHF